VLPLLLSERHIEETAQKPGKGNVYLSEQNISRGNINLSEQRELRIMHLVQLIRNEIHAIVRILCKGQDKQTMVQFS
jgi:hypothetical protein